MDGSETRSAQILQKNAGAAEKTTATTAAAAAAGTEVVAAETVGAKPRESRNPIQLEGQPREVMTRKTRSSKARLDPQGSQRKHEITSGRSAVTRGGAAETPVQEHLIPTKTPGWAIRDRGGRGLTAECCALIGWSVFFFFTHN